MRVGPFLLQDVVESHASGGVEGLAEDGGGDTPESKAETASCWTIRTPTDTRPIQGGGGGAKWMQPPAEWKARAGRREGLGLQEGAWSCM